MSLPSLFGDEVSPPAAASPAAAGAKTQSLYRKYRPQSFDSAELVGQEHIVRTVRNAIRQNRVAHAYLFCGPRGTGKTTTARLLAKAVNCLDPEVMNRPCNACTSCIAINSGATADVIEIDAASNRGIDDIRDLRERVKYAPTQLHTKFYIIDEAHQITGAAANAFLKTLEEPPGHTKFVLATTDPEELLSTIVSRCQRFDFRRIGIGDTIARLRSVAEAESISVSDDALETIARHATGSLRDALGLLDQLAVYGENDGDAESITGDSVRALLGVSRNDRVERLVEAIANRDASQALGAVNDAVESGEDPRQLNRQLVAYLRVLLHERAGGSPDADAKAKELAARFDLPSLGRLARVFSETDYKIRHSPYAQLPLEIALVDAIVGPVESPATGASALPGIPRSSSHGSARPTDEELLSAPPTTALKDRLRQGGRGGHLQVVPTAEPATQSAQSKAQQAEGTGSGESPKPTVRTTENDGSLTVDHLADLWPQIRNDVKAVNRRIEALLASIDPVAVSGGTVTLAAAYDFHRKRMNEDDVRGVVEDAIGRVIGQRVVIQCVLRGEEPPPSRPAGIAEPPPFTPGPSRGSDARSSAPVQELRTPETTGSTIDAEIESNPDSELKQDQQRVQAAKNIFDAEEISNG